MLGVVILILIKFTKAAPFGLFAIMMRSSVTHINMCLIVFYCAEDCDVSSPLDTYSMMEDNDGNEQDEAPMLYSDGRLKDEFIQSKVEVVGTIYTVMVNGKKKYN